MDETDNTHEDKILDAIIIFMVIFGIILLSLIGFGIYDIIEHEHNFGLGSVVTTTPEYEHLTNDSFTGVVVHVSHSDKEVTLRNRDGAERRISTEFLEPV